MLPMGIPVRDDLLPDPDESVELGVDQNLYAPDGTPWCRFRGGLACINDPCLNKNHRG